MISLPAKKDNQRTNELNSVSIKEYFVTRISTGIKASTQNMFLSIKKTWETATVPDQADAAPKPP